MPEGPEVRNIAAQLDIRLAGSNLISSSLDISPQKINYVSCKGKLIVFFLEHGYIASSLGMTGNWIFSQGKYTKHYIKTSTGTVYYDDLRGFGKTKYMNLEELENKLTKIGSDVLEISLQGGFSSQEWLEILDSVSKRKKVCIFLLDQKPLAGIGNYLRAEILYAAGISPFRTMGSLTKEEKEKLRIFTQEIIVKAFRCNGLTIKNYVDPRGEKGIFQCEVYGKKEDSKGRVVKAEKVSGRTIYYVPEVQG